MKMETNDKNYEELRFDEQQVKLTNQQIVEFAYISRDLIRIIIDFEPELLFEEANCYVACFDEVRKMLKLVDPEYLKKHSSIVDFYRDNIILSNDWDHLSWRCRKE